MPLKFLTIIDFKDQFLNTFVIILKSEMKFEFFFYKVIYNIDFFKKYPKFSVGILYPFIN